MIAWRPTSWKAMFWAEWRARGGDADRREQPLRIVGRPLQHLHAAHRAADHREQLLDAQRVEQHGLGADHVADGDHRELQAVGLAGGRIGRRRAGGAAAAAEHVGADDEEAVGVERPAGPDQPGPTSRACRCADGTPAACWSMVSAWQTRTALDLLGVERAVGRCRRSPGPSIGAPESRRSGWLGREAACSRSLRSQCRPRSRRHSWRGLGGAKRAGCQRRLARR